MISKDEFKGILQSNVSGAAIEQLDRSKHLADLGLDSLGFATLLFAIEDKFGIQIDECRLEGINSESTLGDMVDVFERMGYCIDV